ncbi:alanine racemase [Corynebacterium hesseae]
MVGMLKTTVDLNAIAHNVARVKEAVAPARLMCVVKADAYGHGIERCAPVMAKAGADAFGVATLAEAVALRKVIDTLPIAAWLWEPTEDLAPALAAGIQIGIPSLAHAQALIAATDAPTEVFVMVETGMHRSGVDKHAWEETFRLLADTPHITVLGLMSHFACADEPEHPHNDHQETEFRQALELARELGLECPLNHLANSPAALTRPSARFEQVRVGLVLYGLEPVAGRDHGLKPAMTWEASVVAVKPISAGESTCYGLTWTADSDRQLATVSVGYADGLPRAFQGALQVGIGGELYPQVGRVCMDQIVVDLGANPHGVRAGETAVIFGRGGMSATELAEAAGTINYEVLCRPTGRTQRTYREGASDAQ